MLLTDKRNSCSIIVSSVAVKFDNYSNICLLDCGEGTQHYILKSHLRIGQIQKIFISRLNSTSCLGIIGLLATFASSERNLPLSIYAPLGFSKYLRFFTRYSHTNFVYSIFIHKTTAGLICQFDHYQVLAVNLFRKSDIWSYAIVEREKLGRFKVLKATRLKVPSGPLYGKLKMEARFLLPDGSCINGQFFCEGRRRGRKIVYSSIFPTEKIIKSLGWKADIFVYNTFSYQNVRLVHPSLISLEYHSLLKILKTRYVLTVYCSQHVISCITQSSAFSNYLQKKESDNHLYVFQITPHYIFRAYKNIYSAK